MPRAKGIIFTFFALCKTGQTTALANSTHAITSASEDFMGITLVAHIPDQFILGRVKYVMQCHGQFHNPKARAQMTTRTRYGINHIPAHFVGQLFQLINR